MDTVSPTIAIFLWEGFMNVRHENDKEVRAALAEQERDALDGYVGAAAGVGYWATVATDMIDSCPVLAEREHPGVFEYEVCEPFGLWLRRNGTAESTEARCQLAHLTAQFFSQGGGDAGQLNIELAAWLNDL